MFSLGVFVGVVDKFPLGAAMNKGYITGLFDRIAAGDLPTRHLATHPMRLEDGPRGYRMFKEKEAGCVRAVFQPWSIRPAVPARDAGTAGFLPEGGGGWRPYGCRRGRG